MKDRLAGMLAQEKAFAARQRLEEDRKLYNPLNHPVERELKLPLYYTGLTDTARISEKDGQPKPYSLDRHYHVTVPVTLGARGCTWLIIR